MNPVLKTRFLAFRKLIWATIAKWQEHHINWLAAGLAYYAIFSLAPTFLLVVTGGGFFFGEEAVTGELVHRLTAIIGFENAQTIQTMIEATRTSEGSTLAKVLSVAIVFLSATAGFANLQNAVEIIWKTNSTGRHWIASLFMERIVAVLLILLSGILLLSLVLVDITLAGFGRVLAHFLPVFTRVYVWTIGTLVVSFLMVMFIFAIIYKTLANRNVAWSDVWYGAALGSLLFTAGKFFIANFLTSGRIVTLFGAASSVIAILIWVYFSAQVMLLGAAFSYCYSKEYGTLSKMGSPQEKRKRTRRWLRKIRRRS
ncbi:MAG: YihY/virulence factor BrkB family protein [Calditrichia bacterium]